MTALVFKEISARPCRDDTISPHYIFTNETGAEVKVWEELVAINHTFGCIDKRKINDVIKIAVAENNL